MKYVEASPYIVGFLVALYLIGAGIFYGVRGLWRTLVYDRFGLCPKCKKPFDVRHTGPVDQMYGPYVTLSVSCSRCGTESITHATAQDTTTHHDLL